MKVSIEIITKNREKELYRCLNSLIIQTTAPFEVIIVDASDYKFKYLREFNKKLNIKYIRVKKSGFSYQRNIGLKKAKGEIFAIIDDDCIASKNWIEEIIKTYQKYKKTVAIQGYYINIPKDWIIAKIQNFKDDNWRLMNIDKKNNIEIINTRNIAFKLKFLKENRIIFSENYFFNKYSGEDVDLGKQILSLKGKIIYNKNIKIKHFARDSFIKYLKQEFRIGVTDINIEKKWNKKAIANRKKYKNDLNLKEKIYKKISEIFFKLGYYYGKIFINKNIYKK